MNSIFIPFYPSVEFDEWGYVREVDENAASTESEVQGVLKWTVLFATRIR